MEPIATREPGARSSGAKIRLNVSVVDEEHPVGRKFLVLISQDAHVSELEDKIRSLLQKEGVPGRLLRLHNSFDAQLPSDEQVADVLHSGEEVTVVVTQIPEPTPPQEPACVHDLLQFHEDAEQPPPVEPLALHEMSPLQGPMESFEEELRFKPRDATDWQVGKLTPKLREFVSTRFKEVHGAEADPAQTFITMSMCPRERSGANQAIHPVHFSIARIDVIEFERLCGRKIQEVRRRLDYFHRCRDTLISLLDRGAHDTEYAPNMLPYRYRGDEEFGTLLKEADQNTFGQLEGFRPVIVVDTSGAVGESLTFISAALKRMLYSFVVAKSKFNMIKFSSQGRPVAFESQMVPPTAQKLREAEEFLDGMKPSRGGRGGLEFLEGVRQAMNFYEADMVYLLSAGLPRRADAETVLSEVRKNNLRGLPVNVIGVDCDIKAELELRRLAEENQGSFRQKRFDGGLCIAEQRRVPGAAGPHDDARLTIGGQLSILEIMVEEQDSQTADWLEEQQCANRLLLTTATQQAVPTAREARCATQPLIDCYQGRGPNPTMQELIEGPPRSRGMAPGRRGAGQPAQRASSQPRLASGRMSQTASELRRPSMANPWDRPTGVVKVSSMTRPSTARKLTYAR
mmetsp:Transcript_23329/g.59558  ORF Transcript_23329/g.59558 Transcript_23329/m.59558 type:complete len:628 (-) Transcript_23329:90-1973(-)